MALVTFDGSAPITQAKKYTYTVGGSFSGETFTITRNSTTIAEYTQAGSDDADAIAAGLVADLKGRSDLEAVELKATDTTAATTGTLTIEARTAGQPFTTSVNTPGGSATFAQEVTTAHSGPSDYGLASNYAGNAVGTGSDTLLIQSTQSIKYGLDNSGVALGDVRVFGQTGVIGSQGDPLILDMADSSRLDFDSTGISYIDLRDGLGVAPDALAIHVTRTATPTTGYGLYLSCGDTNPIDDIDIARGYVAIGYEPGDTDTDVAEIRQGHSGNIENDTKVWVGEGVSSLTLFDKSGGSAILNCACTTARNTAGSLTTEGSGAITTLSAYGGEVYPNSIGTITNLNVGEGSTVDFTRSQAARTVTNTTLEGGTVILDLDAVTLTNAPTGFGTIVYR